MIEVDKGFVQKNLWPLGESVSVPVVQLLFNICLTKMYNTFVVSKWVSGLPLYVRDAKLSEHSTHSSGRFVPAQRLLSFVCDHLGMDRNARAVALIDVCLNEGVEFVLVYRCRSRCVFFRDVYRYKFKEKIKYSRFYCN